MALPATDNFTGTNGDSLSARTGWTVNAGGFAILSNGLRPHAAATENGARWSGDTFGADQYAQCTVVSVAGTGDNVGVAARVSTSGALTWYGVYRSTASAAQFFKNVAGTWTQFGSDITGWANGDTQRIEANGTTIRVLRGATQVATVTDSAIASGAAGVSGWTDGTSLIDDWEGGDLGVAVVPDPTPLLLANPMRPFKGIIGKVALALRTARTPAAVASAATPVTFTPSAAVSTWTAPTPVLTAAGVTLSPTAASSTWVAGTPTLTVGALSLAPVAATSTWTVPAPSLSAGALSLTPTAAASSWVTPTPVLSAGGVSLAPSAAVSTWTAGAATLTPGALSLAPTAPVSTWTAGTASLGGGSQLTPSAAVSTWVAGAATLSAGALALSPSAPSCAWVSGAPSFTPGGLTLAPTAPASTWTVPAPVLAAGAVTLAPAAATRAWSVGAPSLSLGAISILSSSAIAVWVVPSPSFFSNTTIHLDEPLSIDFTSLATAIDFDSLATLLVFLNGGQNVFELTILEGEVATVTMILQGADPVTGVLEPYDVSAASSLKFTAGGKSGTPIIAAKDLTKVNGGADGVVSFTPTSAETATAGRYDALAVATFPGSPSIVRKFPGKLTIKDAIV